MEETLTAPSGLLSKEGAPVPLVGVSARAEIRDYACRVVLSQRFRNDEDKPIEAVYKFPLEEGAAVCGFEVEIDDHVVKGRVEEREKAFETYDDALAAGHGAYLLDEERPDVFTASVGNLPLGKEAVLRLTTVSELPLEGDSIRFTLPTTIAPRYAPAQDQKGVGETEAERVSPPYALEVPYGLTLEVDVQMSAPVRSVESPSHPVSVTIDAGRATVRLSEREAALDRDVVLKITLAETHEPRALVERAKDGRAYALVSFRPKLERALAPAEVLFVVDRSGSMQGTSIAEARNALQLALRSLRPGCRFNIIGFGSKYQSLFPESRAYDDASLNEASKHVTQMEANLGGTEILPALEHALAAEPTAGLPRQLFVLTDGEVTNADEVIALGRSHAGHARIFTFGIGAGASRYLLKGLARAGEGEAEFIAPGERIEAKVLRQLQRALASALTDVGIDWGSPEATQSPHEVPPLFVEGRVLVFARLDALQAGTVTLRAVTKDGPVSFISPIDPAAAAEGTLVGTLWARRMIQDLEEGRSELHPRRGSQQARALGLKDEKVKAEIVSLGTTWSLVSRHTSFVAVEERENPTQGDAQLRKVPVAITKGWHGAKVLGWGGMGAVVQFGDGEVGRVMGRMPAGLELGTASAMADEADEADGLSRAPGWAGRKRAAEDVRFGMPTFLKRAVSALRPAAPSTPRVRPLDKLVALQLADGSWNLNNDLAHALGWPEAKQLRKSFGRSLSGEQQERAAATALALEWLDRNCADTSDEWRLLADKAREWLAGTPEGAAAWLDLAKETLARQFS